MNARDEIIQLMNAYCYAIDQGDLRTFGKLLEHAEWTVEGKRPNNRSHSNLILYEDGTPRTKHTLSNITLDIDEAEERASGRSYVIVYQQTDTFPLQPIYAGEYFDEFERVDGQWRFARRDIRHSLIGDMSAHLKEPSQTIPGA